MLRTQVFSGALMGCLALLGLPACGSSDGMTPPDTMANVRDVRVPMPTPDPAYLDFPGPDTVFEAGSDKMTCMHFRYDGEGVPYSVAETIQGKFGHHAVLLKAKKPLPPGTVEDCSTGEDMWKYDLMTIPGQELDPGRALWLPGGTALVYQSHYLNSSQQAIRVRDVMRFKKVDPAKVQTWVAPFATGKLDFVIPAGQDYALTYDCQIPFDSKLILALGHMHEWGTKFSAMLGPDTSSLQPLVNVNTWNVDFRDNPPVTLFLTNPMPVPANSVVRTHCEWHNDTSQDLPFPNEMCSTVGFFEGRKEPYPCLVGQQP